MVTADWKAGMVPVDFIWALRPAANSRSNSLEIVDTGQIKIGKNLTNRHKQVHLFLSSKVTIALLNKTGRQDSVIVQLKIKKSERIDTLFTIQIPVDAVPHYAWVACIWCHLHSLECKLPKMAEVAIGWYLSNPYNSVSWTSWFNVSSFVKISEVLCSDTDVIEPSVWMTDFKRFCSHWCELVKDAVIELS